MRFVGFDKFKNQATPRGRKNHQITLGFASKVGMRVRYTIVHFACDLVLTPESWVYSNYRTSIARVIYLLLS